MDNSEPRDVYVDTNYKHKTTIRRTENGLQPRTMDSPKKQKTTFTRKKIHS